jgi:glycosyltransferase involved in cell wall biosynthesis
MITYNHEKFIAQAIESVLMQKTDFPFELVIGEDCSTDGTREIVREYSRKYPGIIRTHLRERNIGSKENSRQLFLAPKGKYIAILEGDDYWTSAGKMQIQADLLDAHPETVLCAHRTVWHFEDGAQPDSVWPSRPAGIYDVEGLLKAGLLNTCSVMFRRIVDRIPDWIWRLPMGDIPLFALLGQYGNFHLLDETMGVYRIHRGGMWSNLDDLNRLQWLCAMYQAFYENLDPKYRPLIREKLFWSFRDLADESFTAGQPGEVRACLRECLRRSGPLEHLRVKAWLAFKGYCWWIFPIWRRLRRNWRSVKE